MKDEQKEIWFPAKRYGYGWGLPVTWQGWIVFLSYLLLVGVAGFTLTDTPLEIISLIAFVIILTAVLLFICIKKGERAAWRWGDKN
ncbi:MAG TPA: hypothetical protein DCX54_11055 [Flavobacteriales bacterium]|nr:hypothetical protein [Flavobacteriales bacterium]